MSEVETPKIQKTDRFANWRTNPFEIKIMDLSVLAWLAIGVIEVIFAAFIIDLNERTFAAFLLPFILLIITLSFRLRLQEKPDTLRNTFITWAVLFGILVITTMMILIFYPPLI
ncbi:MAG: hypothetical protein FK734_08820 [Asgard group archaeon]|nr:hypothetical protein [Asgard group archaeon]